MNHDSSSNIVYAPGSLSFLWIPLKNTTRAKRVQLKSKNVLAQSATEDFRARIVMSVIPELSKVSI